MVISEEQRRSNEALKERLLRKRAFREAGPVERPLAQLAATERKIAEDSSKNNKFFSKLSKGFSRSRPYLGAAAKGGAKFGGGATKLIVKGGIAAGSAAGSAASAAHEKIRDSDPGFVLFIAGMLVFAFNEYIDNYSLALIIATFFMFYSALTVFEKEGIVFVTLFFIWYVGLGGRYDIAFIRYYAFPLALAGMLVHGLVKKFRHTVTVAEGAIGELKGGAIPILLFIMDLGLIDLLLNYFKIPAAIINITFLKFVPWWGLLGIFTTRKDTTLITVLRVLAILYIISLIFVGVAPSAYGELKESVGTGPEELFQARLDAQKGIKPENPLTSYGTCLITGRLAELDVCVSEEQKKSLAKSACKNMGITSGAELDQCLKDELAKMERGGAKGTTDLSRKEFLTAEFMPVKDSFPRMVFNEPRKIYPATLLVKNPLQQQLGVEVNCKFTRGSVEIQGEVNINGEKKNRHVSSRKNDPLNILCQPSADLNGRYTFEIEAVLMDIVTTTTLTRALVKTQLDKERWEGEIKSTALAGFDSGLSRSADEFARLNYGFGNFPDDPIIIADRPVVLSASVEDLGKGQLKRIKSYTFSSFLEKGIAPASADDQNCLQRGEIVIPQKVRNYHLTECFLELTSEYKSFSLPFIVETFEAQLVYDYSLTQKVPGIQVEITPGK